jgi:hypothetical protein
MVAMTMRDIDVRDFGWRHTCGRQLLHNRRPAINQDARLIGSDKVRAIRLAGHRDCGANAQE